MKTYCEKHEAQEGDVCPLCTSIKYSEVFKAAPTDDKMELHAAIKYTKGRSDGIKEAHAECKKILEHLAQDFSNSTIDGRLSPTQETFNNTMFQVITKIKSLIKFHYGKYE